MGLNLIEGNCSAIRLLMSQSKPGNEFKCILVRGLPQYDVQNFFLKTSALFVSKIYSLSANLGFFLTTLAPSVRTSYMETPLRHVF